MMRSMFAGVSGLKTHQTRMDVIGNNIANVNTVGYKASRVTFKDLLYQQLSGATAPTEARGGTNPQQVGLGVALGSIDVRHTQGNTQATGYITDLAIEGDGFFILALGNQRIYTRAGAFGLDNGTDGNLVSLINGARVLGYKADVDGNIDLNAPIQPLHISTTETIRPRATTRVIFGGNLDNRYTSDQTVHRSVQVYDSRGREHTINVHLNRADDGSNNWEWSVEWVLESNTFSGEGTRVEVNKNYVVQTDSAPDPYKLVDGDGEVIATSTDGRIWKLEAAAPGSDTGRFLEFETALKANEILRVTGSGGELKLTGTRPISSGDISFYTDGTFSRATNTTISFPLELADPLEIELDFSQFTHFADTFTGKFLNQDGYTNGTLESFSIDQNGRIVGSFSNGLTRNLGQVALARFANAAGLERAGSTMFMESANSGQPQVGAAGTPGFGSISPSSLEMSNVDLSEEFTELIITQRGFQANSRVITSSDEMLQELVNLKR